MASDYHFVTVWRVPGTVSEVRAVLSDGPTLPDWWPAVYLDVHVIDEGGEGWLGAALDLHTKGYLPYTIRWILRVVEPITDAGFAISAEGDFEGAGRWTWVQDGPEVEVTYDWRLEATKPLLVRLGWLLKPAFAANHKWAMAKGQESLVLEMRRRRATSDEERRRIPPPPPATFRRLSRTKG